MIKDDVWYGEIKRTTDWGGDSTTLGYPVAGEVVQAFIKGELNQKIGTIYHDQQKQLYLCFTNVEDRELYLLDPEANSHLVLGSLKAPSTHSLELELISKSYNAIQLGQTGNYLEFGFKVLTQSGQDYVDNLNYTIEITRNANVYVINNTLGHGRTASINIDEYLQQEGTTSIVIKGKGQATNAEGSAAVTYEVVNLQLTNTQDISATYDLSSEMIEDLILTYSLYGSNNVKYVDWYLDGEFLETDTLTGGTAEPLIVNKNIIVNRLTPGVHNIQFRARVNVNGDDFTTDTYYREFMVTSKTMDKSPLVAVEMTVPKQLGIIKVPAFYDAIQYQPYTVHYGIYNPLNLQSTNVKIELDGTIVQTIEAPNHKELNYTFIPSTTGVHNLKFITDYGSREFEINVSPTDMDIEEITTNRTVKLSAVGRSNEDADRDTWISGECTARLEGFKFNSASGWNDNSLVIGEGDSLITNIKPLANNNYGKTIEIEYETSNVINDDAIICDLRNEQGLGLLITASEASLRVGTEENQLVSRKFKANERYRFAFVIDPGKKLINLYINGHIAGAVKFNDTGFKVDEYLKFVGSTEASIKLKQILVYDAKLSADQILNNHILYRDTVEQMLDLYDMNDILEGSTISVDKVSQFIPVMLITGDVNWLESQKDTDAQIAVDVEYINKQFPHLSFKLVGACLRIQGTSSAGYPKKNFRLYTNRKKFTTTVYNYLGEIVESKKLSFKDNAVPVNCWCLKADYAESSGTHNTGVATLWNDVMYNSVDKNEGYVLRTVAQQKAIENDYKYDVRTTVDGFPIVVFARQTENDEYVFIGKYNFNNDKSTENVFGFCDIPGFDDTVIPGSDGATYGEKMQCWEIRENGNNYALFKTTDNWFDQSVDENGAPVYDEDNLPVYNWASGFEARYPDDGNEADTTDLYNLLCWVVSCEHDPEKFDREKADHIDLWKTAAYYVYFMRFGAVDQLVKNSMLTSEDGKHWYYINYDNDTIGGLKNTGALVYPPTITRDSLDGNTYVYAGHESVFWNLLENNEEFMRYVSRVDTILYDAGLTYETVMRYFNTNQSDKWCQRIYNKDAEYKYLTPSTTPDKDGNEVNTLAMLQGDRKSHRNWWFAKRFKLMDGKFNNSNYVNQHVMIKLNGSPGLKIGIVAGDYMYYGCQSNSVNIQMGVLLDPHDPENRSYEFYKKPPKDENGNTNPDGKEFAVGDPVYVYAPYAIEELDISAVAKYLEEITFKGLNDPVLGTRLKKLIMHVNEGNDRSQLVEKVVGLAQATNLEYLDIRGLQAGDIDLSAQSLLKTLLAKNSSYNVVNLPDGCLIERLQLSGNTQSLTLSNLPNLKFDGIENIEANHISKIRIINCPSISDNYSYFYNWIQHLKKDDELILENVTWTNISPETLLCFKKFKEVGAKFNLKGKVVILEPTIEQVEALQEIFGDNCFTNGAEFWVSAPESVFIHGAKEVRSGDSATYTTTIFSENPGSITWEVEQGDEWVYSVKTNPDGSGTFTFIEDVEFDHEVIIKAIHTPTSGDTYIRVRTFTVISKKVVYSTSGYISGNATIQKNEDFNLTLLPDTIWRGNYTTEWVIEGESYTEGKIGLTNLTNTSCTVTYNERVIFDLCKLVANVTNKNGSKFRVELTMTVTDDSVLLTSTSNPEVMKICYEQGWSEGNPDVLYKEQAQKVITIGTAFRESKIKTFNELEEFKNIIEIPTQAFQNCNQLTEIKIPINVQELKDFALSYTNLSQLVIPSNVSKVHYTSFMQSPIKEFIVDTGNVNFTAIDGVLISRVTGELIKYPEGKEDETYVTDPLISKLGKQSIRNTKIVELTLSDYVYNHDDEAIQGNSLLTTINIGKSLSAVNLAQHIYSNPVLTDFNVSDEHETLSSVDGVLYDKLRNTLWKFPEGKAEFVIESVIRIGSYAFARTSTSNSGKLSITLPDSVKSIGEYAFYANYKINSITCNHESQLNVIEKYAFQLVGYLTQVILSPRIAELHDYVFDSCYKLGTLIMLAQTAPIFKTTNQTVTTTFGMNTSTNSLMGRDVPVEDRKLIVPSKSSGYDDAAWTNSILNESRNNFTLIESI